MKSGNPGAVEGHRRLGGQHKMRDGRYADSVQVSNGSAILASLNRMRPILRYSTGRFRDHARGFKRGSASDKYWITQ